MQVRLLEAARHSEAASVWRSLEDAGACSGLACSWDWTSTWLDHYGDAVDHRFAIGSIGGTPCAATLVTCGASAGRGRLRPRTLHLGTAGEPEGEGVYVEYNRLVAQPETRDEFAVALLRALEQERDWDVLRLDGFAADEAAPLLAAEPRLEARREPSPYADLTAARESGDFLSLLGSSRRQRIRRSIRAFGDIESEWARDSAHALDILAELEQLHQRRWSEAGEPGAFASERFRGFHRALIERLLPTGRVILFRARASAGTLGCLYSFVEGERVLFYQSGLASFDDNRLRPGSVLHALCMQACLERGFAEYDFLAGESRYKSELATAERELVWATRRRRRLRLMVADLPRGAKRALRRLARR